MLRLSVSVAVVLFGCVAFAEDRKGHSLPGGARKELARLQGVWVAREFGVAGKRVDVQDEQLVLEIKGDRWVFDGIEKGEIVAIDPTAAPKRLDLKSLEVGLKGRVEEGIYKVEGDRLTVCWHQGKEKQRPTNFGTSPERPGTILAVFERREKK